MCKHFIKRNFMGMKLLFKQRFFSWLDSYDIYDEAGNTVYTVQGRLAWGHKLEVCDATGAPIGMVREEILTFLPRFTFYLNGQFIGQVKKEFTLFKPVFTLNYQGWRVEGDWLGWDYSVNDTYGNHVFQLSKQLFNFTDTYVIDVPDERNALLALMITLAIDAAKCSENG
ncbi:LURP-one-related family protein [Ruminococcaceae bacterium OttesenSCG-928-A16]|nr:LURP-one-related family protein [Ruminococcaceae bacterium OttesenSCG-928-A16]